MTQPSFDLRSQAWIPALFAVEPRPRDVSLREALASAGDIREIAHPSPLVTAALHRLLLAVLHRVFGPEDDAAWQRLWRAGRFDIAQVGHYLDSQEGRFDLFHPERPFFQSPGLPRSAATSVAKLGHENSAGNNPLLFDHSRDEDPAAMALAEAARQVAAHQAFAIGGLIGRLPGDPPSAEAAHLVKAAVVLPTGDNLFETLLLNMVRRNDDEPFDSANDAPAWEQGPPSAEASAPRGYLDLLTWQSRRILLFPDEDGATVRQVAIMAGCRFPHGMNIERYETMVGYAVRKNPAKGQPPWGPVGFQPERALWRDSIALLQGASGPNGSPELTRRPMTLNHLNELQTAGYLDRNRTYSLRAFGMSSDRAKVFLWRAEQMPLPAALLREPGMVAVLEIGVKAADDAGRALRASVRDLSARVLAPDGDADPKRVGALVDSLAPERSYWPALDVPFRDYVLRLSAEFEADAGRSAMEKWGDAIRGAAWEAMQRTERALETSGRGFHAAAVIRPRFTVRIAKAVEPLMPAKQPAPQEVSS